jgi:DNA-binding transcriptional MerR regulator
MRWKQSFAAAAMLTLQCLFLQTMQQQPFLFDLPDEKNEKMPSRDDGSHTAHAHEKSNGVHSGEDSPIAAVQTDAIDPFASVRLQQEEKIENMLLLPKARRGRKSFKDMDEETILVAVPDDEVLFQKQYYPMRTVAEWFGITLSQLRKWENEFDILQPKKNARGDRFFRPEDVKNIELIYHLIRRRKFTVAGAKQYLKENKKSLRNTVQLLDALNKFKQFLLELRAISE